MSLTRAERETVITTSDADEVLTIWTAQRPIITKLKKNPAARLIDEGRHDGTAWAEFELPAALLSFRSKRMTRPGAAEHLRERAKAAA
jgi:hypothetical protein